jgi:hypothetical protein
MIVSVTGVTGGRGEAKETYGANTPQYFVDLKFCWATEFKRDK